MERLPLTDELLQNALQDGLHESVRETVDSILARIAYNLRPLPRERSGPIVQRVLAALATLPGEHWLTDEVPAEDDMRDED